MSLSARIFTGDYGPRQKAANNAHAVAYIETHQNSYSLAARPYGLVEVASNASQKSKDWATDCAARLSNVTGIPTRMRQIPAGGRGDYNIRLTAMPAILTEAGPISHEMYDAWIEIPANMAKVAEAQADSIRANFSDGLVALSIGHRGKTSSPNDWGAGDVDHNMPEGAINEAIVGVMLADFTGVPEPTPAPTPVPPTPKPVKPPTLCIGDSGDWVHVLQVELNEHYGARLKIDNDFGRKTLRAVKRAQRKMWPWSPKMWDGVVGGMTWGKLGF